jgi:hypothetical protein
MLYVISICLSVLELHMGTTRNLEDFSMKADENNKQHKESEQDLWRFFEGHRMATRPSTDADVEGDKSDKEKLSGP